MSAAPTPFSPSVTVAAVIERDGRFLLVQEETADGVRLNQPAGHLDPDETLPAACAREVLEETAYQFRPTALLGAYLARYQSPNTGEAVTYLRFAFTGMLGEHLADRALDEGILGTLWLTREEIAARVAEHRTPILMQCIDDYLAGRRFPLELLYAHESVLGLGGVPSTVQTNWAPACAGATGK
ncbi:MAG: NUDIX hydrolase [Burkholderiales bacterium]|nr:NUDIX hydrolase [Burkholderiales bacterium]